MGAALITDPDNITRNVDVEIDPELRTITINNNGTGISANGVTGQCLYSYLKEEWKANNTLIKTDFPLVAITPEKFEFVDDWEPVDDTTRKLIRTAGWRELFANTTVKKEYLGVITLGNIDFPGGKESTASADHRAYYAFAEVGKVPASNTTFTFAGPVNEAIQTFDINGLDYRANTVTTFIRSAGFTYDQTNTPDIGVTAGATIDYGVYRFPLSEGTDLNITLTDTQIEGDYATRLNAANITYLSSNVTSSSLYSPDLTGGPHEFTVLIDATSGGDFGTEATGNLSKNEIYSWVQYQLRKTANIDGNEGANTKPGFTQDLLLQFVGSDLETLNVNNEDDVGLGDGESGVAITNFNNTDINSLKFRDNTQIARNFPFNSAIVVAFNNNLLTDSDAVFKAFYAYTTSNTITSFNITSASGQSATFNSTGDVGFPTLLNLNDYIEVTGSAFANNNSVWKITNSPSTTTFNATLIDDIGTAKDETGITGGTIRRNPVDSDQAIVVQDAAGKEIANSTLNALGGATSISYLYAYDSNVQGGRDITNASTGGADAQIVFRAIGTDKAQYVQLDGQTIERTASKTYSLISGLERNYSNP